MVAQQHVIGDLQFELQFASKHAALAEQGDIIPFIKTELLQLAEQVLDELAVDSQTIRFDEVELDLGPVPQNSMRPEIARRFKEELRRALTGQLEGAQPAAATSPAHLSRVESELLLVQQFLSSGRLPWQAVLRKPAQFDALLLRVLAANATELVGFLRNGSTETLDRLITHLPRSGRNLLLEAFAQGNGKPLTVLHAALDRALGLAAVPDSARQRIWTGAARYLLHTPAQDASVSGAIEAIHSALLKEGIDPGAFNLSVPESTKNAVAGEGDTALARDESSVVDNAGTELSLDAATVLALLTQSRAEALQTHWAELIGPARSRFATVLRPALRHSQYRKTLVAVLDEDRWRDLVTLLAPDTANWIVKCLAELQQLMQETVAPALSERAIEKRLWLYSLSYLAIDRGSAFDQRAYVESVLREIDKHSNLQSGLRPGSHPGGHYATALQSFAAELNQSRTDADSPLDLTVVLSALRQPEASARSHPGKTQDRPATATPDTDDRPPDLAGGIPGALESEPQGAADRVSAKTSAPQAPELDIESLLGQIARGRGDALQTHWAELTGSGRPRFVTALRLALRRSRFRKALVAVLDEDRLKDLVTLLAPDAANWITTCLAVLQNFRFETGTWTQSERSVGSRLWVSSLPYLAYDRGALFDQHDYLESVLRQIASHHELNYTAVVKSFAAGLNYEKSPTQAQRNLQLVVNILVQREASMRVRQDPAQDKLRKTAFDQLDVLRDYSEGSAPSLQGDQVTAVLEQLVAAQPAYLRHLARELSNDLHPDTAQNSFNWLVGALQASAATQGKHRTAFIRVATGVPTQGQSATDAPPTSDTMSADPLLANSTTDSLSRPVPDQDTHSLRDLRQFLWCWPEHTRTLLGLESPVQEAAIDNSARLRDALDAFLTELCVAAPLSDADLSALVQNLVLGSGRSMQYWQSRFDLLSDRHEIAQTSRPEYFAALRLQKILPGDQKNRSTRYYLGLMKRFEKLVNATRTLADSPALNTLRALFEEQRDALYLVNSAGEQLPGKALALLFPRDYTEIRYLAEVINAAARFPDSYITSPALRRLTWFGVFDWLIGQGKPFAHETLARYLAARVLGVLRTADTSEFAARLSARLPRAARPDTWVPALRLDENNVPAASLAPVSFSSQLSSQPAAAVDDNGSSEEADILTNAFVGNAGLVLLAPYVPHLLATLQLTRDNALVDHASAERAAQLLQFAVTDEPDAPEFDLVLNKVLCGIPLGRPLAREFELSDTERQTVYSLIDVVIERWAALGHTSREGLRSSFFQREGRLHRIDAGWQLIVAERAFDMLLDSLPWSYKLIKYPWMEEALHVDWR